MEGKAVEAATAFRDGYIVTRELGISAPEDRRRKRAKLGSHKTCSQEMKLKITLYRYVVHNHFTEQSFVLPLKEIRSP
jgi:hypothetical protein